MLNAAAAPWIEIDGQGNDNDMRNENWPTPPSTGARRPEQTEHNRAAPDREFETCSGNFVTSGNNFDTVQSLQDREGRGGGEGGGGRERERERERSVCRNREGGEEEKMTRERPETLSNVR